VAEKRTSRQPEILLEIGPGRGPLHVQIERALRDALRDGRIASGAAVPSTRVMARQLGVSRGVLVEAYEQLIAEGYLVTRPGSRTRVADGVRPLPRQAPVAAFPSVRFDFRPGLPDVTHFPRDAWSRASRRVLRELAAAQLSYGDARGAFELRAALVEYLGRARGVLGVPEAVVICTGFAQALGVIARALYRRGVRRFAVEDPGHPDQRRILAGAGLAVVGVPVDDQGLRVDRLERVAAQAVLVTPAHQFPSGIVLSAERRRDLLAWAASHAAIVVEDDYDAEYRYDRKPVGALQGLAPERVVYAGSASKLLAPALRLGWLVVPPAWAEVTAQIKKDADLGSSTLEQLVYADFLQTGELDRHLRRMRTIYRSRRDALLRALTRHCPRWTPSGVAAGLHLVAGLPAGRDDAELARAALGRSVRVYPISDYRFKTRGPAGLVLGYAGLTEREISEAVARLAGIGG
jgi:GntR family transcriptional regulator/MocR family aminotransferase